MDTRAATATDDHRARRQRCVRLSEHGARTHTYHADGSLLGMIIVACHSPTSRMGMIAEFLVRSDVRGCGVGSALFAHAMEYLRAYGCTNIGLSAASSKAAVRHARSMHSNVEKIS